MAGSLAQATAPTTERLIEAELRDLPAGSVVLSIGEGVGVHVTHLAAAYPRLRFVATDVEPTFASQIETRRRTERLGNVIVLIADAAHLPLRSGAASVTYARNVLQFVADPRTVLSEAARVTDRVVVFRDVANWPFYLLMRRLQSITLRLRGRRSAADSVWRDAKLVSDRLIRQRAHGLMFRRWAQATGRFTNVRFVGHDLLWWDLDRDVPVAGLVGARFGLRCAVAR